MPSSLLAPDGIEAFCRLLEAESGLAYRPDKAYLFESRLRGLVQQRAVQDYWGLCRLWQNQAELRQPIVEAMVTSETYFFRDPSTFEALPTLLPPPPAGGPVVRLWSVGCSSGQEPCSVLMALVEAGWAPERLSILGLDVSEAMIARATAGSYNALEVGRGLGPERLGRHGEAHAEGWRLRAPLRAALSYRVHNVIKGLPPGPDPDHVFVRNLLIYFSAETRLALLQDLVRRLRPGGLLVLGNSEHLEGLNLGVARVRESKASVYRKPA